jgi:hypothetical protein
MYEIIPNYIFAPVAKTYRPPSSRATQRGRHRGGTFDGPLYRSTTPPSDTNVYPTVHFAPPTGPAPNSGAAAVIHVDRSPGTVDCDGRLIETEAAVETEW